MKKLLAVILCLLMIFLLTACNKSAKNTAYNTTNTSQATGTSSAASGENNPSVENGKNSSAPYTNNKNETNSLNQSNQGDSGIVASDILISNSSLNQPTQIATETSPKGSDPEDNNPLKDIDNGILENTTSKNMNMPENLKLLGTNSAKEENNSKNIKTLVAIYQLDGVVVNWITKDDMLYIIAKGNNQLVVINSKTMMAVSKVYLAGRPAEINLVGDEIYISLPDLCRIDVFSAKNYSKKSTIRFDHEISSFAVDGDYIYYSEDEQHCNVFKKNMSTNKIAKIIPDEGWLFYQPKLYLNKQDNILYVGETGCTGSALYYFDATTLKLKSLYKKNNYGIMNHTRDIFHIGDEIYWGNFRLSDTDAKQIEGRYGVVDYGSINFASKELVSTFEGIFLADTYECIVDYFKSGFKYDYLLVSESNNVFFRERGTYGNIIVGVNYSMQ